MSRGRQSTYDGVMMVCGVVMSIDLISISLECFEGGTALFEGELGGDRHVARWVHHLSCDVVVRAVLGFVLVVGEGHALGRTETESSKTYRHWGPSSLPRRL